jgi:hypothetical protein
MRPAVSRYAVNKIGKIAGALRYLGATKAKGRRFAGLSLISG